MLSNVNIVARGKDEGLNRLSNYPVDYSKIDFTTKRNNTMRLATGIKTLESIQVFDVTESGENLAITIKPVDFGKLTGEWAIEFAEGYEAKREVDKARCETFHYIDVLDDNGEPVMIAKLDDKGKPVLDDKGKPVLVKSQTKESINLRVDIQEVVFEAINAHNNAKTERAKSTTTTKAVLTQSLNEKTSENTALRAIIVNLAKAKKIVVTDDMTVEQINDLLAK